MMTNLEEFASPRLLNDRKLTQFDLSSGRNTAYPVLEASPVRVSGNPCRAATVLLRPSPVCSIGSAHWGVREGGTVGTELVTTANALLGSSCQTSSLEPVKYRHGPNQLRSPPEEAINITYRTALACWLPQRRDGTINHAETARARDHQRVGCDGGRPRTLQVRVASGYRFDRSFPSCAGFLPSACSS